MPAFALLSYNSRIMKIFIAQLETPGLAWRIFNGDPITYDLQSFPGWFFINPIVYPQLKSDTEIVTKTLTADDKEALIGTTGIILGTSSNEIDVSTIPFPPEPVELGFTTPDSDSSNFGIITAYIQKFSENLKLTSKQATIPSNYVMCTIRVINELPSEKGSLPEEAASRGIPLESAASMKSLTAYHHRSGVTWENLAEADRRLLSESSPVYESLILDAILAHIHDDFRRAIMYSAFAAETIAATALDEAYQSIINSGDTSGRYHLRTIQKQKNNQTSVIIDPVYEALNPENKVTISRRLHENSLYLLGKSLQLDNESLYDKIIKLYKTRNEYVHKGQLPSNSQKLYKENKDDALAAIESVVELLNWFGINTSYPLPPVKNEILVS